MGVPNKHLKIAILDHDKTQVGVAGEVGITELRLSKIITGRARATAEEQYKLSLYLNEPVSVLFPAHRER